MKPVGDNLEIHVYRERGGLWGGRGTATGFATMVAGRSGPALVAAAVAREYETARSRAMLYASNHHGDPEQPPPGNPADGSGAPPEPRT